MQLARIDPHILRAQRARTDRRFSQATAETLDGTKLGVQQNEQHHQRREIAKDLDSTLQALVGQVAIEEILRAFGEASEQIRQPKRPMQDTLSAPQGRDSLTNGVEAWLHDPESKLCGRADLVAVSQIVDFKSGDRHDDHADQMLFYAALYLAMTGKSPQALRLVYTNGIGTVDVDVPQTDCLRKSLIAIRQRADAAEKQVIEGNLPAKPEPLKCATCHARGLCGKYWESLRIWQETENPLQSTIVDYAPSVAPRIETAAHGAYLRDSFAGTPSYLYLPHDVIVKASQCARRVRVLSVRPTLGNGIVRLAYTQYSEIYILEQLAA